MINKRLANKIRKRYDTRGPDGLVRRHPAARPRVDYKPKQLMSGKRIAGMPVVIPNTVEEVKQAWRSVVILMEFFGGDRKLAAFHLNVKPHFITRCIRQGYLPIALAIAAERVDHFAQPAESLLPYYTDKEGWKKARTIFDDDRKYWEEFGDRKKQKTRRSGLDAGS